MGNLHYIPIIMFFLMPVLFGITYWISTARGHVSPYYVYISDTGTLPPEMCIFALGLTIGTILIWMITYIRYKYIHAFLSQRNPEYERWSHCLNKAGLYIGFIAGFGMTAVGSFQETNALEVHIFAAMLTFAGGSVYIIIQGYFSRKMPPEYGSALMGNIRICLGVVCLILYLICQISGIISLGKFKGDVEKLETLRWESRHGGWTERVTSTVSEWIMAGLFQCAYLTFIPEFKLIAYIPAKFQLPLIGQSRVVVPWDAETDANVIRGPGDLSGLADVVEAQPSVSKSKK